MCLPWGLHFVCFIPSHHVRYTGCWGVYKRSHHISYKIERVSKGTCVWAAALEWDNALGEGKEGERERKREGRREILCVAVLE